MRITLDIPKSKFNFFLEQLTQFNFVKVVDSETKTEDEKEIEKALTPHLIRQLDESLDGFIKKPESAISFEKSIELL
jgi:hypothetical protein